MVHSLIKLWIRMLPEELGFRYVRRLSSRPARPLMTPIETEAVANATRLVDIGWNGNAAWSWGSGPTVLLVHGWGGRASQMAPLAHFLSQHGVRAVTFDVAGHGESLESEARWEFFIRDIGRMSRILGEVYAYVGHSAGGLSMMAARRIHDFNAAKFVCICAPSHPYPPIRGIAQRLDPGPAILDRYKEFLGEQFRSTWSGLEAGKAYASAGDNLLLCYDQKDRFVQHSDGDKIHALCPGSTLLKSRDHSHTRILTATEIMASIERFICHNMPANDRTASDALVSQNTEDPKDHHRRDCCPLSDRAG